MADPPNPVPARPTGDQKESDMAKAKTPMKAPGKTGKGSKKGC